MNRGKLSGSIGQSPLFARGVQSAHETTVLWQITLIVYSELQLERPPMKLPSVVEQRFRCRLEVGIFLSITRVVLAVNYTLLLSILHYKKE